LSTNYFKSDTNCYQHGARRRQNTCICQNFKDFSSGDKLASWLGVVPNVYQSADKSYNGKITKRGSKEARWILTQIAQAAARKKNNKLKEFFNRKKKSIEHAKAIETF